MKKVLLIGSLFVFLLGTSPVISQCPMCKASVEQSENANTSSKVMGLNNGILYMLVLPYLAIMTVGFAYYRSYRKKKQLEAAQSEA